MARGRLRSVVSMALPFLGGAGVHERPLQEGAARSQERQERRGRNERRGTEIGAAAIAPRNDSAVFSSPHFPADPPSAPSVWLRPPPAKPPTWTGHAVGGQSEHWRAWRGVEPRSKVTRQGHSANCEPRFPCGTTKTKTRDALWRTKSWPKTFLIHIILSEPNPFACLINHPR